MSRKRVIPEYFRILLLFKKNSLKKWFFENFNMSTNNVISVKAPELKKKLEPGLKVLFEKLEP